MDELEKARAEMLIKLKELFNEWLWAAKETNGKLFFSVDMMIEDIMEAAGLDDEKSRAFVFGQGEK